VADAEIVLNGNSSCARCGIYGLVPNLRGCERALSSKVDEINLVMSASESHISQICECTANIAGAVPRISYGERVASSLSCLAVHRLRMSVRRHIEPSRVLQLTGRLCRWHRAGLPVRYHRIANRLSPAPVRRCQVSLAGTRNHAHFHNTRGMGLANVLAALEAGIAESTAVCTDCRRCAMWRAFGSQSVAMS